MSLQNGTRLGDYEIGKPLGHGGMGEVYLARDVALDRPVAVKTIIGAFLNDDMLLRFKREAQSAGKLIHPNIVQIYKVDIESDPPYMAMEYVDGTSLDRRIEKEGAFTWQQALTMCGQAVSGLACAHDNGIIHRDIKPANILLDKNGRVKIADFGLAKMADSSLKMTQENHSIGSPCYMSPEHWGSSEISHSSDLFSLGISVYEMIAGRLPFEANSAAEMMGKVTTQPMPPLGTFAPGVPMVVRQFVETLAERNPAARYQSSREVLEDLAALQAKKPLHHMNRLRGNAEATSETIPVSGASGNEFTALADEVTGAKSQSAFHQPVVQEKSTFPLFPVIAGVAAVVAVVVGTVAFMSLGGTDETPPEFSQQSPEFQQGPRDRQGGPPEIFGDQQGERGGERFQGLGGDGQRPQRGGFGSNVRPPRLNQEFKIGADGKMVDAVTGVNLLTTTHRGRTVPAIKDASGQLAPAGKNDQGQWVKLGPPPNGDRSGQRPGQQGGQLPRQRQ